LFESKEGRLGKFQDRDGSSRTANTDHLFEPFESIDNVPQSERNAHGLKAVVFERQPGRVGFEKGQRMLAKLHLVLLLTGEVEHFSAEVASDHLRFPIEPFGNRQG
jgi:hypothetical protein